MFGTTIMLGIVRCHREFAHCFSARGKPHTGQAKDRRRAASTLGL